MKKITLLLTVFFLIQNIHAEKGFKSLFNGKNLKGWDTYIGAAEKDGTPIGLNKDPLKIFTVKKLNNEPVIHISGQVFGSLATKEEYENYHIRMVFKWGEKVYKSLNSGLLYHSFGSFGAGLGVWMSSHEFQLMTGHMGDSYCMGASYFEIPTMVSADGKNFTFAPTGEKRSFGETKISKNVLKTPDNEKSKGEWNTIDLYCYGRNSVHMVNGQVVMVNYNSGKIENGVVSPLSKGKIQIQSEGGELFIRKIEIESIKEIPAGLMGK